MPKISATPLTFAVLDYELPAISFMPKNPKMGFVLWLYGSQSNKDKHAETLERLAGRLNLPVFCFDYSGHGQAPFTLAKTTPAQHFMEVITVYDKLCEEYGCGGGIVIGTSYGGYLLLQLLKYRKIVAGILRAPALYRPSSFYTRWENLRAEDEEQYRHQIAEVEAHPLLARAGANTAPMLVVAHARDEVIPAQLPKTIAKHLANSEYLVFPKAKHSLSSLPLAERKDYEDQLVSWLSKL